MAVAPVPQAKQLSKAVCQQYIQHLGSDTSSFELVAKLGSCPAGVTLTSGQMKAVRTLLGSRFIIPSCEPLLLA